MVESGARRAGTAAEESRQSKRAREEKEAAQKTAKRAQVPPKPEYKLVSPEEWGKTKQKERTYRSDHQGWREDERDP
jgi:hypothetical protein